MVCLTKWLTETYSAHVQVHDLNSGYNLKRSIACDRVSVMEPESKQRGGRHVRHNPINNFGYRFVPTVKREVKDQVRIIQTLKTPEFSPPIQEYGFFSHQRSQQ